MIDPELDLTLHRIIRAPRQRIWDAWTQPEQFAKWWTPSPTITRVDRLEPRPGGALVTQMSDDGTTFVPRMDAAFLVAEPNERLVFTNAIDSSWRPSAPAPVPMTAEITLTDHADGTEYNVVVRHGNPSDRNRHDNLGFYDGWGSVTAALAELVENGARQ
ncbi:SRPBCC domain-containing protein [Gordonia alkanivorans]|uniref:SRPBCC domain-containing protein n=1 Tax=Gordonia alkanivorans TaxID=84096 RepID=UPI002449000A|nr:SRPBCC domain-containing protein [Gordonia alkanivorans]MDH3009894.1 SRPBCC domain-containing protein [Gordonia alkanivorans]